MGCLLHQSPKFHNHAILFVTLKLLELLLNFYQLIQKLVQTFQPITVIYRRGKLVYPHKRCKYIILSSIVLSLNIPVYNVFSPQIFQVLLREKICKKCLTEKSPSLSSPPPPPLQYSFTMLFLTGHDLLTGREGTLGCFYTSPQILIHWLNNY